MKTIHRLCLVAALVAAFVFLAPVIANEARSQDLPRAIGHTASLYVLEDPGLIAEIRAAMEG